MRTYKFGLANSDRVIEIVAATFTEAKKLNEELLSKITKTPLPKVDKSKIREQILKESNIPKIDNTSLGKKVLSESEIKNIVLKTVVNDVFDNKKIDKIITEKVEKLFEDKINEMVNRKVAIALKRILSK